MKSYLTREKADEFDLLVHQLIHEKKSEYLPGVITSGISLARNVMRYYGDLRLDDSFAKDIVLECLQKSLGEDHQISPTRLLRNIAYTNIKRLIQDADFSIPENPDVHVYTVDIHSRLVFEETLHDVLFLLPLHIQSAILYLIFCPDNDRLFRSLYSSLDYFLILSGIDHLRTSLPVSKERQTYFNFDLPVSQTARLLLISSLYKLSAPVLVLLMQTQNLEIVLQFCKLFGGQTLTIPTIPELSSTVERAAEIANTVEDGFRVGDQESLAYLATNLDNIRSIDYEKLSLNPLLASFMEESLGITLKNYDACLKRLVSSMDTTDPEDILRVDISLNKEIFSQAYLLLQLTTSVENYPSIQKILKILKTTP